MIFSHYIIYSAPALISYGKTNSLIKEHPIYKGLSKNDREQRKRYREFVRGMLRLIGL